MTADAGIIRGIMPDHGARVPFHRVDAIATHGLTKHYGAARHWGRGAAASPPIRALDDLTLAVHAGEIFGFLGPNGAGKSTAIRLLLGFIHPTAGRAEVLGLDVATAGAGLRGRIGYLPGGIALYDSLTGTQLLDYLAAFYARPPILRGGLVERLGLSVRDLARPIRDYSRGMRQKIGIVQALQHDPELAILDEPSEGLDPLMQRAFYAILDECKAAGRTVFFSSHVLSEVERVCDRVGIVRSGRLVALERVDELVARRRRHVEVRLRAPVPTLASAIAALPGVSALEARDDRLAFGLDGDVTPLLRLLEGAALADLTIEPASLEDAFLELYDEPAP
jgi:ABC-2 type transport system ATP-binding protein